MSPVRWRGSVLLTGSPYGRRGAAQRRNCRISAVRLPDRRGARAVRSVDSSPMDAGTRSSAAARQRAWLEDAVAEAVARPGRARAAGGRGGRRQDAPGRGGRRAAPARPSCAAPPRRRRRRTRPIVAALRRYLQRSAGRRSRAAGRCAATSRCCCPSSATPSPRRDRATLFEAIRCALATIAAQPAGRRPARRPAVVRRRDARAAGGPRRARCATCRCWSSPPTARTSSPRLHPLRRLRTDLRRDRLLRELALEPLTPAETAELAERRARRSRVSPALARSAAPRGRRASRSSSRSSRPCCARGRPAPRRRRRSSSTATTTCRCRRRSATPCCCGPRRSPPDARAAAEAAAVAGAALRARAARRRSAATPGSTRSLASGLRGRASATGARRSATRSCATRSTTTSPGCGAGRCTASSPSCSRGGGEPRSEVAAHWLAAREPERALDALLARRRRARGACTPTATPRASAARRWSCGPTASAPRSAWRCSSATPAARSSRASWPTPRARCARSPRPAQTAGGRALADAAAPAGRDLRAAGRSRAGAGRAPAWRPRPSPRTASRARPRPSGSSRPATCRARGKHGEAVELAVLAGEEAASAEPRRPARAGPRRWRAWRGPSAASSTQGVATVRAGLALALEHELTSEAAEVYQRLGTALEVAADYAGAAGGARHRRRPLPHRRRGARSSTPASAAWRTCCASSATGTRAEERVPRPARARAAAPDRTLVADGVLGRHPRLPRRRRRGAAAAAALPADRGAARRRLDAGRLARPAWRWATPARARTRRPPERCRFLLARWEASEDHHYAVWGLRWAASYLARQGAVREARACADALATLAASGGYRDALAALAHALGELALARGRRGRGRGPARPRALDLHATLDIPFERAQIRVRAGVADAAPGQRERALERLVEAHRIARRLGARAARRGGGGRGRAASASRSSAGSAAAPPPRPTSAGLSRRELEVVRLLAVGRHEPRDRARALPQPAHGRHARAQHPRQARLPLPHGGRGAGARARAARRRARLDD